MIALGANRGDYRPSNHEPRLGFHLEEYELEVVLEAPREGGVEHNYHHSWLSIEPSRFPL